MVDSLWMWALMSDNIKGVDLESVTVSSGPSSVNIYNDEYRTPQRRLSIEERVNALERYMYDDERSGEPGLLKAQRRQQWQSQLNSYLLVAVVILNVIQFWIR